MVGVGVEVEVVVMAVGIAKDAYNRIIIMNRQINDPGMKIIHKKRRKAIMNRITMNGTRDHMGEDKAVVEAGDAVDEEAEAEAE